MKYKVTAEIRYTREVGTFEAESPEQAQALAEDTDYYRRLATDSRTSGLWDVHVAEVPSNNQAHLRERSAAK